MQDLAASTGVGPELLGTILIVVLVLGINLAITWMLRSRAWLSRETKLRASVFWRNTSLLFALLALLFMWRVELRAAALSLAALSVALVLAGKELLTSVVGYIHRTTSGSFRFGDVIEINGVKGEVIDQTLLSTTVLEMSQDQQFTGRTVQFPNAFYVTHPLTNHSHLGRYQLGLVHLPLAPGTDMVAAQRLLERTAADVCKAFVAPAEAALREMEGEQFVLLPSAEPRVTLRVTDADRVTLVLRFPCRGDQRTRTEQEILARYLAGMTEEKPPLPKYEVLRLCSFRCDAQHERKYPTGGDDRGEAAAAEVEVLRLCSFRCDAQHERKYPTRGMTAEKPLLPK